MWYTAENTGVIQHLYKMFGDPHFEVIGSFKEIKCYHLLDFTALPKS